MLGHLVDKSLVVTEMHDGQVRYRLLETLRQYANERLCDAGEFEFVRNRHLAFFVHLAEAADAHLGFFISDAQTAAWIGRIESDHDNLRVCSAARA